MFSFFSTASTTCSAVSVPRQQFTRQRREDEYERKKTQRIDCPPSTGLYQPRHRPGGRRRANTATRRSSARRRPLRKSFSRCPPTSWRLNAFRIRWRNAFLSSSASAQRRRISCTVLRRKRSAAARIGTRACFPRVPQPVQARAEPDGAARLLRLLAYVLALSAKIRPPRVLVGNGRRAVEYNCSLAPTSREEAEELYDNIYHLRQFLSGRTLWWATRPWRTPTRWPTITVRLRSSTTSTLTTTCSTF